MGVEHLKRGDKRDANGYSHNWNIHNGRIFGKRYGRKGGKARWASMTQEEKDLFFAKKNYALKHAVERNKRIRQQLQTNTPLMFPAPFTLVSGKNLDDFEELFGDVL